VQIREVNTMKHHTFVSGGVAAFLLLTGVAGPAGAQVVEQRESEANPSVAIFRATLYGAGTGLLVGGAIALVEEDDGMSTGEILSWSVAGGTLAGLLVGLVYVATRRGPEGDAEEVGANEGRAGPHFEAPRIAFAHHGKNAVSPAGSMRPTSGGELELGLVHVTF
jgi:hypothetical protein